MNPQTSTHPGTSDDTVRNGFSHASVEELEQQAERARARVDDTISEIKQASSTEQIVEQVASALNGGPGDFLRNLGKTVKDNPVPTALLAISAVWLASATESEDDTEEFETGDDNDVSPEPRMRATAAYPPSAPLGAPVHATSAVLPSSPESTGSLKTEGSADDNNGVWDQVTEKAEDLKDGALSLKQEAMQRLEEGREEGAARFEDAKEQAARQTAAAKKKARKGARQAKGAFMQQLNENPMVLAGIGIALGAAMGGAIPNTRKEDELLGDEADKLREKAKQAAMPFVEGAQERAHAVLDRAESAKQDLMQSDGKSAPELAKAKVSKGAKQIGQKAEQAAEQLHSKVEGLAAKAEDQLPSDAGAKPGSVRNRS